MPSLAFTSLLEITIHDSTKTDDLFAEPGLLWWQWTLIGLAAILVFFIILLLVKRKSKKVNTPKQAISVFDKELQALKEQDHITASYATELSLIIRRYLHQKQGSTSIFQTNEEINAVMLADLNATEPTTTELLEFLNSLDALKYGKSNTDSSIHSETISSNAHLLMHKIEWELTHASKVPIPESETL